MAAQAKSFSKGFVWIIVILLIVGLAGFGATGLSGTIRTVGQVGSQPISVDDFARELQRQTRAVEAQTGQPLQMSQIQQLGLDRQALSQLVQIAALDNETTELGLSVGDSQVQKEILQVQGFQGLDGNFDRESYRFTLERANLTEAEFEEDLRAESARALLRAAVMSGVSMPETMADTLLAYVGARRSFTWAALGRDALDTPVGEPDDAELRRYYEANPEQFMLPETKRITYALLTPEMIIDEIKIEDSAIEQLFKDRRAEYDVPERRLVERLAFADEAAASDAAAQLDINATTFELLVEQRGLDLSDTDMGDVTRADLGEAAEAVFAAETGDVIGPLPSSLGPAIYRVNGILAARVTELSDVADELRDELAGEEARRRIDARIDPLDDILAGGATVEELANESAMQTGQIDWHLEADEGPAAYAAFNEAAARVRTSDFPQITNLEDGGIFAMRLDETLPRRPEPFDAAKPRVAEAWLAEQVRTALSTKAAGIVSALGETGDFAESGLEHKVENALTRTAFIEGVPASFMNEVFEMKAGELRVVPGDDAVLIVRLDDILPPEDSAEMRQARAAINDQMGQTLAQALFVAFARDAQLRARPRVNEQAVAAVLANFN